MSFVDYGIDNKNSGILMDYFSFLAVVPTGVASLTTCVHRHGTRLLYCQR